MKSFRISLRLLAGATFALTMIAAGPVTTPAAALTVQSTRVLVSFDIDEGQLPENFTLAPFGALDVTLNGAGEIARVSPSGMITVLAAMPAPADGGVNTPIIGSAFTAGMVRAADVHHADERFVQRGVAPHPRARGAEFVVRGHLAR